MLGAERQQFLAKTWAHWEPSLNWYGQRAISLQSTLVVLFLSFKELEQVFCQPATPRSLHSQGLAELALWIQGPTLQFAAHNMFLSAFEKTLISKVSMPLYSPGRRARLQSS